MGCFRQQCLSPLCRSRLLCPSNQQRRLQLSCSSTNTARHTTSSVLQHRGRRWPTVGPRTTRSPIKHRSILRSIKRLPKPKPLPTAAQQAAVAPLHILREHSHRILLFPRAYTQHHSEFNLNVCPLLPFSSIGKKFLIVFAALSAIPTGGKSCIANGLMIALRRSVDSFRAASAHQAQISSCFSKRRHENALRRCDDQLVV